MLMSKLEKAKKEMGSYSAILSESGSSVSKIGDTTYTKIFVGGLAWATQRDSIKRYFEQFGDILEAVVIVDKRTGRSKGYGFVTFKDPDSATKACQNPYPVIDGRRTNCNLAAFGAQRNPPNTPQRGLGKSRHQSSTTRAPAPAPAISTNSFNGVSTYFYQQIPQYTFPYVAYGYPCYPQDMFTVNYYNAYGGQDFLGHHYFGSPNEAHFGSYPMVALHGEEREHSSPRTNPKTTENPRHMHMSQQHYKTETGPNTAVASETATARTTAACDQNSVA